MKPTEYLESGKPKTYTAVHVNVSFFLGFTIGTIACLAIAAVCLWIGAAYLDVTPKASAGCAGEECAA